MVSVLRKFWSIKHSCNGYSTGNIDLWSISKIISAKLFVPIFTLPINDTKFLENIKQGFESTISWNKYTSEITKQPENNNLDYMVDPIFRNVIFS